VTVLQDLVNLATKKTVQGNRILIKTPLINLTKAEIILLGQKKGVDFSKTVSCYQITEDGRSCGVCDACRLRIQAFKEVQIKDKINYV